GGLSDSGSGGGCLTLRVLQRGSRLFYCHLIWGGIQFHQQISGMDVLVVVCVNLNYVSGNSAADVGSVSGDIGVVGILMRKEILQENGTASGQSNHEQRHTCHQELLLRAGASRDFRN